MSRDEEFLNPYNFVPVGSESPTVKASEIADGRHENIRHDAWQPSALHGKIECSLITETPMIIGGRYSKKSEDKSTPSIQIPYYRKNADGKQILAIPGSSLRGLVGSTIEALSNSALRILAERRSGKEKLHVRIGRNKKDVKTSVWEFFSRISTDLIPWSEQRTELTPAEALLGCVTIGDDADKQVLPALAGRLRFKDAVLTGAVEPNRPIIGEPVKLQILSEPKPNSPSFYFYDPGKTAAVRKVDLVKPQGSVLPRGRKWYLHANRFPDFPNWESQTSDNDKNNSQRIVAKPIREGVRFGFSIEFANLSLPELELLCIALKPGHSYRHKLGLGKPLGLGAINLQINSIVINQYSYTDYSPESLSNQSSKAESYMSFDDLHGGLFKNASFESLIKSDIRAILETLGDPDRVELPVCYPRSKPQFEQWREGGHEDELFKWFVNNDKSAKPQALEQIKPGNALSGLRANGSSPGNGLKQSRGRPDR